MRIFIPGLVKLNRTCVDLVTLGLVCPIERCPAWALTVSEPPFSTGVAGARAAKRLESHGHSGVRRGRLVNERRSEAAAIGPTRSSRRWVAGLLTPWRSPFSAQDAHTRRRRGTPAVETG
jgi:hypothetical protein